MTNNKFISLSALLLSIQLGTNSVYAADVAPVFDVDGNRQVEALGDGLLLIRYLFGFRGNVLTDSAIGTGATRKTPAQIESYIKNHLGEFDLDGNGRTKALSDGLLTIRYLFGFRGATLIKDAVEDDATRKTAADIEAFFKGTPKDVYVNTPSSQRCTRYGLATYTFKGRKTGTGTVSVQDYTGKDHCSGSKIGVPRVDNNLTYSLTNLKYAANNAITATMTIWAFGQSRTRNVSIKNGIVTLY